MPIIEEPAFHLRIAMRHEKLTVNFPGFVHLAVPIAWISHAI